MIGESAAFNSVCVCVCVCDPCEHVIGGSAESMHLILCVCVCVCARARVILVST